MMIYRMLSLLLRIQYTMVIQSIRIQNIISSSNAWKDDNLSQKNVLQSKWQQTSL